MKGFYSTALEVYLYDLRWVDNHAPSRSILEVFLPTDNEMAVHRPDILRIIERGVVYGR